METNNQNWNRFVNEGLAIGQQTNVTQTFDKLCRRFGKAYIEYLHLSYLAKDELTDAEWSKLNGDVPDKFIETNIQKMK